MKLWHTVQYNNFSIVVDTWWWPKHVFNEEVTITSCISDGLYIILNKFWQYVWILTLHAVWWTLSWLSQSSAHFTQQIPGHFRFSNGDSSWFADSKVHLTYWLCCAQRPKVNLLNKLSVFYHFPDTRSLSSLLLVIMQLKTNVTKL
jgi:hypothetical protein